MALIVQKYGGTSVATIERIEQVARKVIAARARGDNVVVVVSAMSGETDRLLGLAHQIAARPDPREVDVLISTGEQVTIALLAMTLQKLGCPARSYTGAQIPIVTDAAFGKARIAQIDATRMQADLAAGRVVVAAGFQGVDADGDITTL
ncbi:MAG: aspartate kinase, partial [Candidatus Macondimonas sp.]